MTSETLKAWIGDPDAAPAERKAAALTVRAFLASDDPSAHAKDVAGLPGDVAGPLVEVLEDARAAERLAVVKVNAADRAIRKAAGKALHRLKSRGVDVPDVRAARRRKVDIGPPEPPPSWFTHHDSTGAALTILGEWDPSYGPFFVLAIETEEKGLKVSDLVRGATRKMERELIHEMHLETKGVVVERDVARSLVADAARRTQAAGQPLPDGWDRVAPFIGDVDESLLTPSVDLAAHDRERILAKTPRALEAVMTEWLPDGEDFNETAIALHAAASSQLAISDQQREEFVADALARRMDAWFDANRRADWARRFERAALLLDHRRHPEAALTALASAEALRDAERPASTHPVLRRRWEQIFDLKDLVDSFHAEPGEAPAEAEQDTEPLILRP